MLSFLKSIDPFGIKGRHQLAAAQEVMRTHYRGIYKRVDENRELLELIQHRAPRFLVDNPWAEDWLKTQDEFFADLLKAIPIDRHRAWPENFPQPWPQNDAVKPRVVHFSVSGWEDRQYEKFYEYVLSNPPAKLVLIGSDAIMEGMARMAGCEVENLPEGASAPIWELG